MIDIPQWLSSLLSVVAGGLLVGFFNWFNERSKRQFEDRQKLRELIFETSVEMWKKEADIKMKQVDIGDPGNSQTIYGLEAYIMRMTKLSELLQEPNLTNEQIEAKLKEVILTWQHAIKGIRLQ